MRKLKSVGLAIALWFFATGESRADLMLTLSSTDPDLTQIQIGDTIQFNVTLSGLILASDTLDFLATDVKFQGNLLGTPVTITPGPIIVDLSGLAPGGSSDGQASVNYDDAFATSGAPIQANGLFFSFTVVAQAAGLGTIYFSFTDAFLNGDSVTPTPMNSLPFTVLAARAIPEPSALILCAFGAGTWLAIRRARLV